MSFFNFLSNFPLYYGFYLQSSGAFGWRVVKNDIDIYNKYRGNRTMRCFATWYYTVRRVCLGCHQRLQTAISPIMPGVLWDGNYIGGEGKRHCTQPVRSLEKYVFSRLSCSNCLRKLCRSSPPSASAWTFVVSSCATMVCSLLGISLRAANKRSAAPKGSALLVLDAWRGSSFMLPLP